MYSRYRQEDFDKCVVNPYYVKDVDRKEIMNHPFFRKNKKFMEVEHLYLEDLPMILTYLVCQYDMRSPFNNTKNIIHRKAECAEAAGFEMYKNSKEFTPRFQALLNCEKEFFNSMILEYCRLQNHDRWTHLIGTAEMYYKIEAITMKKIEEEEGKDEVTILKNQAMLNKTQEDMLDKMDRLRKQILNNDDNRRLELVVYKQVNEMMKSVFELTPENIAYEGMPT